jgi:hypothetical protein
MVYANIAAEATQTFYLDLTKPECVFAAIWHNPTGAITTAQVAQYYQISESEVLDVLKLHHLEFDIQNDDWSPRSTIRLGLLLNSPVASSVRALALEVIEAYKQPSKRASIRLLLENSHFVEWSDRSIARILECSHTAIGKMRKELESSGNVLPFTKRKHIRDGKEVERKNQDSGLLMATSCHEQGSNPDSFVPKVKVISEDHLRYGQEGIIIKEKDGHWQKVVRFDDGEEIIFSDTDLDAPSVDITVTATPIERKLPKEYEEAITQLKEQHRQEKEDLERELFIQIKSSAEAEALVSTREQLEAAQRVASEKAKEVVKLQQQVEELNSLRSLEAENQQLRDEIERLNRAWDIKPPEWDHPLNKKAIELVSVGVQKIVENLEPELHLRALAVSPPSDAKEALRLMAIAMGNLAKALNDTNALSAAAILLKCKPTAEAVAAAVEGRGVGEEKSLQELTPSPLVWGVEEQTTPTTIGLEASPHTPHPTPFSYETEREQMIREALRDIRLVLSQNPTWGSFWAIAREYEVIKREYWKKLNPQEKELIGQLVKHRHEEASAEEGGESVTQACPFPNDSRVMIADQYSARAKIQGTVIGFENENYLVHWDDCDRPLFQHRYEERELKLAEESA